ncbi:MAG: hypothetical protein Q7R22_014825 [Verrucomicrobiota bacterium JB025]|nr:hypothetical protein [Verrucomicrobiota bacterium JB025]
MKLLSPATIAALILIGAGGFITGRLTSSSPDSSAQTGDPTTAPQRSASRNRTNPSSSADHSIHSQLGGRITFSTPAERDSLLEKIIRGENPLDRNRALIAFIDKLGPDDFEDAVASFRSLGITEQRFGEYAMLLSAWADSNPLAALEYARTNTRGQFATNTILSTWASSDPDAAIRWADSSYDESDGANPFYAGIIRAIADSNPELAESMLTSMPRSGERGAALDAILPSLMARGSAETRTWIDSLTDDSLRNGAMLRTAETLAQTDPEGTAQWLLENPGDAADRRTDDVYDEWAKQDPAAALASLSQLQPGETRSDALRGVISAVAANDPQEGLALLDQYPEDVNDRVVRNFVWSSFGTSPSIAMDQVSRIENEGYRNRFYERAIPRWYEEDPNAASTWIQSNELPENIINSINRRIENN